MQPGGNPRGGRLEKKAWPRSDHRRNSTANAGGFLAGFRSQSRAARRQDVSKNISGSRLAGTRFVLIPATTYSPTQLPAQYHRRCLTTSRIQKLFNGDTRFPENGAEGSFREVAAVVRNGDFASRGGMTPDFMAAWSVAVESESENPQPPRNLPVLEPRQAAHQRIPMGTTSFSGVSTNFANDLGSGSPCSRQDSTIFRVSP